MFSYTFVPKLLNMSITASIAIAAVIIARLLLKKAPRVISYVLWSIVLIRLLCPIAIPSPISAFERFTPPINEAGVMEYIPENIVHMANPVIDTPSDTVNDIVNSILPSGTEQTSADPLEAPAFVLYSIWLLGAFSLLALGIWQLIKLRLRVIGVQKESGNIYLADGISTAFMLGIIRPKIYVPSGLEENKRALVIMHENRHIARFDNIIRIIAYIALCIHWFNPLVWLAFVLAGRDMEVSCDEAVLKHMGAGERADYSQMILDMAAAKPRLVEVPVGFGGGSAGERIRSALKNKKAPIWVTLISILLLIGIGAAFLTNPVPSGSELLASNYNRVELVYGWDTDLFGICLTTDFTLLERAPSISGYERMGFMEKYPVDTAENELSEFGIGGILDARYFEENNEKRLLVLCKNGEYYYAIFAENISIYKVKPMVAENSSNGPFYDKVLSDNLNAEVNTFGTYAEGDIQIVGFYEGDDKFGFASFKLENGGARMLSVHSYEIPFSGMYYCDDAAIGEDGSYNVVLNINQDMASVRRSMLGKVDEKSGGLMPEVILLPYQSPYIEDQTIEFIDRNGNVIGTQVMEKKPDHEFGFDPEHPMYTSIFFSIVPYENAPIIMSHVNNSDTFAISSVMHLATSHIDSKASLDDFALEAEKLYDLNATYDNSPEFSSYIERYDESFFEEYGLVIIQAGKAKDAKVLRIDDISIVNGRFSAIINESEPDGRKYGGGDDPWLIVIEMQKGLLDKARDFDSWRGWKE